MTPSEQVHLGAAGFFLFLEWHALTRFGTKKADQLILALAAGSSVAEAARTSGVSKRTAFRYLNDPDFKCKVDVMRAGMVSEAVGKLSSLGTHAGNALEKLLKAKSPHVRLSAARAALEFMFRGNEQDTLARRVAALEERYKVRKKKGSLLLQRNGLHERN
jgi:hypothetical protein